MLTKFGRICKNIRLDRDEFLFDMADKVGISSALLSAVEHGTRNARSEWVETIIKSYSLSETEADELRKAAKTSVTAIRIELKGCSEKERGLVISFAERFKSLDDDEKEKILKILNK